ncbi:hypothetical protein I4U23_005534 [Adineta vaga]|nr:hypothetical protein I4U23_005534 [Adineta vaga]
MMMMNTNHSYLYYDPNSISNFNRFHLNHTHFDLNVDFDSHILHGYVQLDIVRLNQKQCEYSSTIKNNDEIPHNLDGKLVLDAYQLNIEKIIYKTSLLPFKINTKSNSLIIDIKQIPKDIISISILIYYSTSSNQSKALQWMSKEQTTDRQYPYMCSQCQAIHARSLYPCQDTSGVKSIYTAKIICPKPLIALMSAFQTKHDVDTNTFYFEQTIVVPSYLIAIAVGHFVSYDLRTEHVLSTAEQLLGEYQWKRYDFLVLPLSLTSVIVHELTHSWTVLIDFGSTNPYTCLVYRLKNIDHDDAYNSSAALLWYVEHDIVCSEIDFDQFLRSYIKKFTYQSLNTDDFIQYFESYFPQFLKPMYAEFELSWPEMMIEVEKFFEKHKKYIHPPM